MSSFIVLLRAVNVGGTAKVPMQDLREALMAAGFSNVRTYIASGNIYLDSDLGADAVCTEVDNVLNTKFGVSGARSIVRDVVMLKRVLKANPFLDAAQHRPQMLHVHFLASAPVAHAETNLTSYKGPERLRLDGLHLYVDYVNGAGSTSLSGRFLETALGVVSTSRNWNTVQKLADLVTDADD
jgi:uncharacterized protein (DUF1697 family)